ncbi:MAG: hypothetical protein ACOCQQ_03465, partial [Candidatus Nanoarchaeia archaeon]
AYQEKILADLVEHLFVGFMVKERSSLRIIIGQVAAIDEKQFDIALRQAFRQFEQLNLDLYTSFETQDSSFLKEILVAEQENNKLTNLCQRLLNKSLQQKDKGHFWYVVAWNLEKVVDSYKYIAHYFLHALISLDDSVMDLLAGVVALAKKLNSLFYSFSFEKLVSINQEKKILEQKITNLLVQSDDFFSSSHQRILLHYLHIIILQIADFSASTIALRFEVAKNN